MNEEQLENNTNELPQEEQIQNNSGLDLMNAVIKQNTESIINNIIGIINNLVDTRYKELDEVRKISQNPTEYLDAVCRRDELTIFISRLNTKLNEQPKEGEEKKE